MQNKQEDKMKQIQKLDQLCKELAELLPKLQSFRNSFRLVIEELSGNLSRQYENMVNDDYVMITRLDLQLSELVSETYHRRSDIMKEIDPGVSNEKFII